MLAALHSPAAEAHGQRRNGRRALPLLAVLLLIVGVFVNGIGRGEFHLNTDEAHHAFTGLFVADLLRDLPLRHPIDYTYRYYAHYPVLGLIHWPPFFYLVEGAVFLVLGPSVVSARLAVLLFALFGLYFWFRTVRELQNQRAALASTLALAFVPSLLLYEKSVMLEVPSMALCIAASYCWIRFLRAGTTQHLYWCALFASLALLTKQQSIYLLPFCLLTLFATHKAWLLLSRSVVKAFALSLLLAGPFYLLAFAVHSETIAYGLFQRTMRGISPYLYYWVQLPAQTGWFLLLLALGGLLAWRWWEHRQGGVVMLLWIAACYATSTFIAGKEPRYILYWLPPFAYFAAFPFATRLPSRYLRAGAVAFLLAFLAAQTWTAWRYQRPYIAGYGAAARRLAEISKSPVVLLDTHYSANFMFFLRTHDPSRRLYALRKALYVMRNGPEAGSAELAHSAADLEQILDQYGIQYIVVDQNAPLDFAVQKTLRNFLQRPRFRIVYAFPVTSNLADHQNRRLLIYKNTQPAPQTATALRLQMMTLNHDITVPLESPGGPKRGD